jgi:spoIIIJ-associated protein
MSAVSDSAKKHLEDLITFFGINALATVSENEDGIELDIEASSSSPRLIGHHGETLRALEYLVNQMIRHEFAESPRINVDIAGYRLARRHDLEQQAREIAARVTESGQEEALVPMNPAERRIVHMILREIDTVETESRGEDRARHIVVLPAK